VLCYDRFREKGRKGFGCRENVIVPTSVVLEDLSNFTKENSRCSPLLFFFFFFFFTFVQLGVVVPKV